MESNIDNGRIGCHSINNGGNNTFFTGNIMEVAMWNVALTSTQVASIYGNGGSTAKKANTEPTGLRVYYPLSGTTVTNEAGMEDVVFDADSKIGDLTYSGNEITLSGSTSFVHSINGNMEFQTSGTQVVQCVAEKTGTSAWIAFGLADDKVTASSDHTDDMEYAIKSGDDGRTWIRQSSGAWTQVSNTSDNVTFKISNDRTTVTYYADGSSIGTTTHGTPNATYYLQATVAQTGTAGSYTFDYTGDVIRTTGANAWVEKGTAG